MRLIWQIWIFLFGFSLMGQSFSERKISRMLKKIPVFEKAHISIHIESIDISRPNASFQEEHYMTPASNIKLFTFLASLQNFDSLPSLYYHYEKDSIIHFKSTGYPLLFHPLYPDSLLGSFFEQNKSWYYHKPKRKINSFGPGWSWDDYSFYFAAEISPFPIFGNTVKIFGDPEEPRITPEFFKKSLKPSSLVDNFRREKTQNIFSFNSKNLNGKDTIFRPFITSDSLFVKLLNDKIKNSVKIASTTTSNIPWKVLYTKNENLLYKALLSDSDNGIAESLLVMLSQKKFDEMNIERIINALKQSWSSWLVDPIEWVDGSGVSRYNMVTTRSITAVLKKIYNSIGWEKIKTYFPESKVSGTLKMYSLKNVFAKTGTLRHNYNLSGYFIGNQGNTYVFSIMVNHFTLPKSDAIIGISEVIKKFQKKLK